MSKVNFDSVSLAIAQLVISEKFRYLLAGAWNTLFGFLAFAGLFFLLTPYSVHYRVILLISQAIAITSAFLVYKFFVFNSNSNSYSNPVHEYIRFVLVYLVALTLNFALMFALVDFAKLDAIFSQGISTVLTVLVSYVSHKKFSFRVG